MEISDMAWTVVESSENGATLQRSDCGHWAVCDAGMDPQHASSGVTQTEHIARSWFADLS